MKQEKKAAGNAAEIPAAGSVGLTGSAGEAPEDAPGEMSAEKAPEGTAAESGNAAAAADLESEPSVKISSENTADPANAPANDSKRSPAKKRKKSRKTTVLLVIAVILLILICGGIFGAGVGVQYFLNSIEEKDAAYIEAMSKKGREVDLPGSLRSYTADRVSQKEKMAHYTYGQIQAMDLSQPSGVTEDDLRQVLTKGLTGLEGAFVLAEEKYGVNCVFLASIASHESALGTHMFRPNNLFGYGKTGFSSKEECIMTVAQTLGSKYLTPGAGLYSGPTVKDVNKRYAADSAWNTRVAKYMTDYYAVITDYHNQTIDSMNRLV